MSRFQENILFLMWSLPIIAFSFFLISIRNTYHSTLIFKTFILCLSFTVLASYTYRRTLIFGEAFFLGIVSVIIFGIMPKTLQILYWITVVSLTFIEFKNLYKILNREKIMVVGVSFFAILLTFIPFFNFEYSQPNSMVKLLNSGLHNDTLYHVAMASMWKVHHAVSHGLHGLGALEYHYGSHLLMAGASSLLGITTFESYSHFFGFFCIPMLAISCISVAEEYLPSENNKDFFRKIFSYCFILLGTDVLNLSSFFSRFTLWPSFYESESYTLSLILLFTFFSVLKSENFLSAKVKVLLVFGILGLMTITKISSGFFALALLGSWALLSLEKIWSKIWIFKWIVFFVSATFFLILFLSINPSKGDAFFQPLQFVNAYVDFKANIWIKYISFVLVHFFFALSAIVIYGISYKVEPVRQAFPLWWMLGTLISFLVGLGVLTFLNIAGGSGYYVSNVSMFMALPFLLCLPKIYDNKLNETLKKIIYVIIITISLFNVPKILFTGVKSFLVQIRLTTATPNQFSNYIDKLIIIRDDPSTKNSLVYIPHSEKEYWKDVENGKKIDWTCRSAGYIISAISERPAIYGWPSNECYGFLCSSRFHSNGLCDKSKEIFTDAELLSEAKRLGFERVEIITANDIRILK